MHRHYRSIHQCRPRSGRNDAAARRVPPRPQGNRTKKSKKRERCSTTSTRQRPDLLPLQRSREVRPLPSVSFSCGVRFGELRRQTVGRSARRPHLGNLGRQREGRGLLLRAPHRLETDIYLRGVSTDGGVTTAACKHSNSKTTDTEKPGADTPDSSIFFANTVASTFFCIKKTDPAS